MSARTSRRIGRVLARAGLWLGGVWAVAAIGLIAVARPLIYPFQPGYPASDTASLPGARAATVTASDGLPLTVWLKQPAPGRPVVLFFMGNAGILAFHAPGLARLAAEGYGIAALNYRGAGGTPGEPSQEALTADALALYDGLDRLIGAAVPPDRRVIWGRSLGAALAVQLAARRDAAALVLEAPFNRLCETARHHYPVFPACLLLPYERWDSATAIAGLGMPLLVMHGEADKIIPIDQGRRLFEAAPGQKRFIAYQGRGHNDLPPSVTAGDGAAFLAETLQP